MDSGDYCSEACEAGHAEYEKRLAAVPKPKYGKKNPPPAGTTGRCIWCHEDNAPWHAHSGKFYCCVAKYEDEDD